MLIMQRLPMHPSKRFASSFGMLAGISRLALGVFLGLSSSCALDDGGAADPSISDSDGTAGDDGGDVSSERVCNKGRVQCHAHIRTFGVERARSPHAVSPAALPAGFGPADLQSAYGIDPNKLATTTPPLVAITDAFGYPNLEADLALYRQTYGLPPCTTASGCLKIVNQQGQTTNLPALPPANDDWTVETALDVDMVSAACPRCRILVVQAADDQGNGLDLSQNTAATLGATVISDSWGSVEQPGQTAAQALAQSDLTYYKHTGLAIFVASGDAGYDETVAPAGGPTGPGYPATSQFTIAVGATRLVKAAGTTRGWTETAWAETVTQGKVDVTRGAGRSGRRSGDRRGGLRHQRYQQGLGHRRWHQRRVAVRRGDLRGHRQWQPDLGQVHRRQRHQDVRCHHWHQRRLPDRARAAVQRGHRLGRPDRLRHAERQAADAGDGNRPRHRWRHGQRWRQRQRRR
jgi:hypothetical protein